MFTYRNFEIGITRSLSNQGLGWPGRGEAGTDSGLGCNRSYSDLRGLSWGDARRVFELETTLVGRIEAAADPEDEYEQIEDELYEEDEGLFGLDIGVASATVALCAAGCVTCSSCNAGAYGGHHHEHCPVIAFFAKAHHVEPLFICTAEAGIGIEQENGMVIAFVRDIRDMRSFAAILIRNRSLFRAARPKRQSRRAVDSSNEAGGELDLLPLFGKRLG